LNHTELVEQVSAEPASEPAEAVLERERHSEPERVNEWNKASSRRCDLKCSDRASAHAGAGPTSLLIVRGLRARSGSSAGPKTVTHASDRDYCPSTRTDRFAIHISYARTSSQMIGKRAERLGNLHGPVLQARPRENGRYKP
jgi:hypothetical protein